MTQQQRRRHSTSPYIDRVTQSFATSDGSYLVTPDGSWDLIMSEEPDGSRIVFITGQATQSARLPYKAGQRSVVISFTAGSYFSPFRGAPFKDDYIMLTMPDPNHFEIAGYVFPLPTYESAEEIIDLMVSSGLLSSDEVVDGVMRGKHKAASQRSVERHFKSITGLSPKKIANIRRAQQAVRILKSGASPSHAAAEAGYYDQPHLTKELKRLMGSHPSDVNDVKQL